jgi:hypothetical protein
MNDNIETKFESTIRNGSKWAPKKTIVLVGTPSKLIFVSVDPSDGPDNSWETDDYAPAITTPVSLTVDLRSGSTVVNDLFHRVIVNGEIV